MPANRCPAREAQTLAYLEAHGESALSDIATALGVKPSTAAAYVNALRHDGLAHPSGIGHTSKWRAGPKEPRHV